MSWKGRRRLPAASSATAGPPDPAEVRRQLEAEQEAQRRQWMAFIAQRVLPLVDQALGSSEVVTRYAEKLSVIGSRRGVTVSDVSRRRDWIVPLLEALQQSRYTGYTVRFLGTYDTGASYRLAGLHSSSEVLDKRNVVQSIREFRSCHQGAFFQVEITL